MQQNEVQPPNSGSTPEWITATCTALAVLIANVWALQESPKLAHEIEIILIIVGGALVLWATLRRKKNPGHYLFYLPGTFALLLCAVTIGYGYLQTQKARIDANLASVAASGKHPALASGQPTSLGLTTSDLTNQQAQEMGLSGDNLRGAKIKTVTADGPSKNVLQVADVIRGCDRPLPDPSTATMASSGGIAFSADTISLYECRYSTGEIDCLLSYERKSPGSASYVIPPDFLATTRLFDNLLVSHKAISAVYCNGLQKAVETVDLDQGEQAWMVITFDDASPKISTVRISYPIGAGRTDDLTAPLLMPQ